MSDPKPVLKATEIAAQPFDFAHPLQEDAQIRLFPLSHATGLTKTGVSLGHLSPGHCSFPMHRHLAQDEWIYILTGTAVLQLGDERHDLATGDFAAFPAGGPAHKLTNEGTELVTYLMGGDKTDLEVADFPELGKRLTFSGSGLFRKVEGSQLDDLTEVDMFERVKTDE